MVNNNNLIPKTELVQELKSEIPSFEEFMGNYENDEKVNKSYEAELDSYEEKEYGPCRVCSETTRSIAFKIACPAVYCDDREPGFWKHSGCSSDSRMQITNKGDLSCDSCGVSYNMSNWNFACSNHRGDYRSMGKDSWAKSMSIALGISGTNQVVRDLNVYVVSHPEKFGFNS